MDNNGIYQLAGINSLVNTVLDSSGNPLSASLYDEYGYYYKNSSGELVQITTHTPESSFATRISSKMDLIRVEPARSSPACPSDPINNDGNLSIYTNMTTGAVPADHYDWWSQLAHEPGHAPNRSQQRRKPD